MHSVPTTREVLPGALVNIVLKADQPTGRTVQGTVAQLLTRGNHPRGIKVRLADGRVGRVQSMARDSAATVSLFQPGETVQELLEPEAEMATGPGSAGVSGRRGRHRNRPGRGSEEQPLPTQLVGLDAYIKPARKRGKASKSAGADAASSAGDDQTTKTPSLEPEEPTCPVCGDFRGDVAAMTHHVQSHFDD
ncbi:3e7e2752-9a96-4f8e-8057-fbc49b2020ce [Thermothielavioides terrestris]|uniref:UBZ4-type domain-containing protein n=2 Tax=Thermothielavioides terrestris TaxID=2587410 RepID=G2R8M4_THETT|nr:uncharacterized protein THITE_2116319 [Thermothielavioides terrestris NRRL 8126]AEO67439.1 hypothetical protein THITE_2116319 [Thermothielavioides terrestris NRRL 8126]SPQ25565.1 3e7e2752-9a96-4f8e-8057-fbc49b2020ce [Thermothielavioides terrestris]